MVAKDFDAGCLVWKAHLEEFHPSYSPLNDCEVQRFLDIRGTRLTDALEAGQLDRTVANPSRQDVEFSFCSFYDLIKYQLRNGRCQNTRFRPIEESLVNALLDAISLFFEYPDDEIHANFLEGFIISAASLTADRRYCFQTVTRFGGMDEYLTLARQSRTAIAIWNAGLTKLSIQFGHQPGIKSWRLPNCSNAIDIPIIGLSRFRTSSIARLVASSQTVADLHTSLSN